MTFGILTSGRLGKICLEKLLETVSVTFVLTDKGSTDIVDVCKRRNIPVFAGNPRNGEVALFLKDHKADVILSVNYLFIVGKDILQHPASYAINFHGSLLPKYRGRTPHVWAIINNEKETGITAHLMTEECDEGDIILQEKIAIAENHTGADILTIFLEKYPPFINQVIDLIGNGQIRTVKQDEKMATYFGKRNPEDGLIDWNWQKERIRNWVRAQAHPYPGAFTYYGDSKVVINKIEYSDYGFHCEDINGTILFNENDGLIVKTPNGAIKIIEMSVSPQVYFKKGERFA